MAYCLLLALFVPPVYSLGKILNKKSGEIAPLVLCSIALVGYFMSLLSQVAVAVRLLQFVWLASVIYAVYINVKSRRILLPDYTAIWFVFGFVLMWYLNRGRQFYSWDEFSHWGLAVKSLFFSGKLISIADGFTHNFASYPPGIAPFIYVCMRACGLSFREDLAMFLQAFFTITLLYYVFSKGKKHDLFTDGLWAIGLYFLPMVVFYYIFTTLRSDGFMGLLCAFILVVAYFDDGDNTSLAIATVATALLCGAVKPTGIVFGMVAGFGFFVLHKRRTKNTALSLLPMGAGLVSYACWKIFMRVNHVPVKWTNDGFSFQTLKNVINGTDSYRPAIITNFFKSIFADFNYGTFFKMSYVLFTVMFVAVLVAVILAVGGLSKEKLSKIKFAYGLSLVFVACFAISILYSYMFVFSQGEGSSLASISRYLNSATMVQIVLGATIIYDISRSEPFAKKLSVLAFMAVCYFVFASPSYKLPIHQTTHALREAGDTINLNRAYYNMARYIRDSDTVPTDRVCIISEYDLGKAELIVDYALFPQKLAPQVSSVTTDAEKRDELTYFPSRQAWRQTMAESFDYIIFHFMEGVFAQEFTDVIDNPENMRPGNVFRIDQKPDGDYVLTLVDRIEW